MRYNKCAMHRKSRTAMRLAELGLAPIEDAENNSVIKSTKQLQIACESANATTRHSNKFEHRQLMNANTPTMHPN